jgi:hypothetical protein
VKTGAHQRRLPGGGVGRNYTMTNARKSHRVRFRSRTGKNRNKESQVKGTAQTCGEVTGRGLHEVISK